MPIPSLNTLPLPQPRPGSFGALCELIRAWQEQSVLRLREGRASAPAGGGGGGDSGIDSGRYSGSGGDSDDGSDEGSGYSSSSGSDSDDSRGNSTDDGSGGGGGGSGSGCKSSAAAAGSPAAGMGGHFGSGVDVGLGKGGILSGHLAENMAITPIPSDVIHAPAFACICLDALNVVYPPLLTEDALSALLAGAIAMRARQARAENKASVAAGRNDRRFAHQRVEQAAHAHAIDCGAAQLLAQSWTRMGATLLEMRGTLGLLLRYLNSAHRAGATGASSMLVFGLLEPWRRMLVDIEFAKIYGLWTAKVDTPFSGWPPETLERWMLRAGVLGGAFPREVLLLILPLIGESQTFRAPVSSRPLHSAFSHCVLFSLPFWQAARRLICERLLLYPG